ncbi:MAG: enoyl-[acyl-carrier-protein] reductase FabK [Bacilli bacterium]|nr:enoyl-[acyl-carrier-protein] reductase FabK [Bacilli bacterium]
MNQIAKLLGTKYPLIQGGMANIADHRLASAVSNAGGLGLIASAADDKETVREKIRKCKELTSKPFGVNIMLMSPNADQIAEVVIEEHVKVVTTGAGNPGKYMEKWKEAGIIVIPVIASTALAKRMERAGADAIIAEGQEAGGHIGELTTMALIPQVVDQVKIPVIAAGGIGDYRGVLAAFALGAKGIQVGTALLVADECPIHQNYKDMVLRAKDSDTIVTGRETGTPVRVLKNPMAREYVLLSQKGVSREELERLTLGSLKRAVFDGDIETGSFMAGQIAGLVDRPLPVEDIIESLFEGVVAYKKELEIL